MSSSADSINSIVFAVHTSSCWRRYMASIICSWSSVKRAPKTLACSATSPCLSPARSKGRWKKVL